jgi:hypothetical protein
LTKTGNGLNFKNGWSSVLIGIVIDVIVLFYSDDDEFM